MGEEEIFDAINELTGVASNILAKLASAKFYLQNVLCNPLNSLI
jgi:hypothetical protein